VLTDYQGVARSRFTDLTRLNLAVQVGNFHSDILGWGFYLPQWWRNYLHVHSFFEICYAYAGHGLFRINQVDYEVQTGDIFVAKPSEPHEIISSEDDPLGIYFWSYTLTPSLAMPVEAETTDALLQGFMLAGRWVSPYRQLQPLLDLLTEEAALRQPGHDQVIRGLLVKLLLDTARAVVDLPAGEVSQPAGSLTEQLVQKIVRYLHDNYNRRILVRDVAAQVHLSERHTNRIFRETMGLTILDYLTNLRLEIAAQRLLDRQLSVKAVAHASGYPDVHYFATLFRRRMGMTPALFQQKGGTRFLNNR
jgi:AraC-like DNA-binding protein